MGKLMKWVGQELAREATWADFLGVGLCTLLIYPWLFYAAYRPDAFFNSAMKDNALELQGIFFEPVSMLGTPPWWMAVSLTFGLAVLVIVILPVLRAKVFSISVLRLWVIVSSLPMAPIWFAQLTIILALGFGVEFYTSPPSAYSYFDTVLFYVEEMIRAVTFEIVDLTRFSLSNLDLDEGAKIPLALLIAYKIYLALALIPVALSIWKAFAGRSPGPPAA